MNIFDFSYTNYEEVSSQEVEWPKYYREFAKEIATIYAEEFGINQLLL